MPGLQAVSLSFDPDWEADREVNVSPAMSEVKNATAVRWPAIVVGAGVAGAAAAAGLAARGIPVLLLEKDRLPRGKPCGGCLNGRAVQSLDRLGLRSSLDSAWPLPLDGLLVRRGESSARLNFPREGSLRSYSISRKCLDAALAEEAQRLGATLLTGIRVLASRLEDGVRTLQTRDDAGTRREFRGEIVLACDGLGSGLARAAGLTDDPPSPPSPRSSSSMPRSKIGLAALLPHSAFDLPERWITMATHGDGYVGVVGVKAGERDTDRMWNVAGAVVPEAVRKWGGPWETVLHLLQQNGIAPVDEGISPLEILTCPSLFRRVQRPWARRLLFAGDAAGYVEPFTGEGMAWALAAAEEAIDFAVQGWRESTGPCYEKAWRRRVGDRRWTAAAAARILDSPSASAVAFTVLRSFPFFGVIAARALARERGSLWFR